MKQNLPGGPIGLLPLIVAVAMALRGPGAIFRPLERMDETIGAVVQGDVLARTSGAGSAG